MEIINNQNSTHIPFFRNSQVGFPVNIFKIYVEFDKFLVSV